MTTIALLMSLTLSGPHTAPLPVRSAVIVVEPAQHESRIVLSEWNRAWRLSNARLECEQSYRFKVVERSRTTGITNVPCVILGEQAYPIRTAASGDAVLSIRDAVRDQFADEFPDQKTRYWIMSSLSRWDWFNGFGWGAP